MPKIFVLADDLTGAAEIGGVAFQYGLTVRLLLEPVENDQYPEDVIIVDSDTRSLSPEQAEMKISAIISRINLQEFGLVFNKVDSILRGPVISGIRSLLRRYDLNRAFLVPANPSRNRTVRGGKYYVDGRTINQTDFRFDPEYPRLSETVSKLIIDNSGVILTGALTDQDTSGKVVVPDITSEDDMHSFVSGLPGEGVLLAGASDFFSDILRLRMNLQPGLVEMPFRKAEFNHFIIGSHAENTKKTIDILTGKNYSVLHLPESAIDNQADYDEWISLVKKELEADRQIVITGPAKKIEDKLKMKEISIRLTKASKIFLEKNPCKTQLFIEGGETASLFFRSMGWLDLQIHQTWDEGGVVLLGTQGSCTHVAIKPGSYRWPDSVLNS